MQPEPLPPRELALHLAARAEALSQAMLAVDDLGALEAMIAERAEVLHALDLAVAAASPRAAAPAWRDALRVACERALAADTRAAAHLATMRDAIGRALTQLDVGAQAAGSYLTRGASGQVDAIR